MPPSPGVPTCAPPVPAPVPVLNGGSRLSEGVQLESEGGAMMHRDGLGGGNGTREEELPSPLTVTPVAYTAQPVAFTVN